MTKQRLFLGVPPDDATRKALCSFQEEAHVAQTHTRWTPAENLHLTLFFIGPVLVEQLDQVKQNCADAPVLNPFQLSFDRFRLILRKKKPDMIWAQYHLGPELEQLVHYLAHQLEPFQKRKSSYKELLPHCTLARIRPGAKPDDFHWPDEATAPAWEATGFCLYESQLHPKGARYKMLENYPFKGHR